MHESNLLNQRVDIYECFILASIFPLAIERIRAAEALGV